MVEYVVQKSAEFLENLYEMCFQGYIPHDLAKSPRMYTHYNLCTLNAITAWLATEPQQRQFLVLRINEKQIYSLAVFATPSPFGHKNKTLSIRGFCGQWSKPYIDLLKTTFPFIGRYLKGTFRYTYIIYIL